MWTYTAIYMFFNTFSAVNSPKVRTLAPQFDVSHPFATQISLPNRDLERDFKSKRKSNNSHNKKD